MVDKIAAAAVSPAAGGAAAPRADFGKVLGKAAPKPSAPPKGATPGAQGARSAAPAKTHATPGVKAAAPAAPAAAAKVQALAPAQRPGGAKILTQVQAAQGRLDQLLKLAESGKTFSPAELLAFQAHAYRASQELDMASKVVEKGTSAVKQTLQTQI